MARRPPARKIEVFSTVRLGGRQQLALEMIREVASRRKLRRESVEVETRYGKIRVKVGHMGKTLVHAAPEYEDCRRAAEAAVPLKHVYDSALDAFRRR